MPHSEDGLRSVMAEYDEGKRKLLESRDAQLRAFYASGWRPVDLQRVTGYSRETIRQALHPEARRAANASRRKVASRGAAGPPAQPSAYADRKPYVVADDLTDLRGPTEGTIT